MAVSVKDVIGLSVMEKAVIVAGALGVDRFIRRVSFIDAPFSSDVLEETRILMPGDFYISSLFVVKDDPEKMLSIMRLLLLSDSSGLCIVSKLLLKLPSEIIDFANENNYPIIFINSDASYGDIIKDISALIIHDTEDALIELKFNNIIDSGQSEESVKKIVLGINGHFQRNSMALYCRCQQLENSKLIFLKDTINRNKEWICLRFRENILIILTFDDPPDEDNVSLKTKYVMDQLRRIFPRFLVGISTFQSGLGQMDKRIAEAMTASGLRSSQAQAAIRYDSLGSYKFLLPLRDRPELREFHDEIVEPIIEYDQRYKQDLLNTAIQFINNDGDFSQTAKSMALHENSIRYRISKIMEIMKMHDKNIMFYEHLSIAIKLHKILNEIEN